MVMELVQGAGYKGEITSTPQSSLFSIKSEMMRGGRLLNYE